MAGSIDLGERERRRRDRPVEPYDAASDELACALRAQAARVAAQTARLKALAASEHLPSWEELLAIYEDAPEPER